MLSVVALENAVDIPANLRRMADEIEAGEHPGLRFVVAVAVGDNAKFTAYCWGQASTLECMGALARALARDLVDE